MDVADMNYVFGVYFLVGGILFGALFFAYRSYKKTISPKSNVE